MSKQKTILASFKKGSADIEFYQVHSIYNNNKSYVLRKQGTNNYYLFIRSLYVLIDLKTMFPPEDEETLARITHSENTVDSNCLMFYADSDFVKFQGLWTDKDLIALKNRCLKIKFAGEQAKSALEDLKNKSLFLYIKNWFIYIWNVKRQDRKVRKNLKGFKILW